MKTDALSLVILFVAASFLFSCKPKQAPEEPMQALQETPTKNVIRSIPSYEFSDTVKVGSHTYRYSIQREADKDLPIVTDDMGDRYYDNVYQLSISRDGTSYFSQRFTKNNFSDHLNRDFRKYAILDGFRFNRAEDGLLYFSVCVSYPESDMIAPFILTVASDGSSSIQKDDSLDGEDE